MFTPIWDIELFDRRAQQCNECGMQLNTSADGGSSSSSAAAAVEDAERKLVQHMLAQHPQYAAKLVEKQLELRADREQQQQKQYNGLHQQQQVVFAEKVLYHTKICLNIVNKKWVVAKGNTNREGMANFYRHSTICMIMLLYYCIQAFRLLNL